MSQSARQRRKSSHALHIDFDRFMGWFVYVFMFCSILYMCCTDLTLLGVCFLLPKPLAFWQGIIHLFFRTSSPGSLNAGVGFFVLGSLLGEIFLLWLTYRYGKWVIVDFIGWKNRSALRQLELSQRTQRQLTFLYTMARFENERVQFTQRQKQGQGVEVKIPDESVAFGGTIRRVGPFSWFYLWLLNYLFPPSAVQERRTFFTYLRQFPNMLQEKPEEEVESAESLPLISERNSSTKPEAVDLVPIPAPPVPETGQQPLPSGTVLLEQEKQRSGSIYVFATQPILLLGEEERVPLHIKDPRRLSLFMYLAVYTRYHTIRADDILHAVYEEDERDVHNDDDDEGGKIDTHRQRFYKDVSMLRQLFKQTAQGSDLPYSDPIEVDGRGKQAIWKLSNRYEVVDVTALEHFYQYGLKDIHTRPDLSMKEFRNSYKTIIEYYRKGFLSDLVRKQEVGSWARALQMQYQEMYRQIIWKVAEYEKNLGLKSSLEERNICFQQAAWLYEKYARETAYETASAGEELPLSEAMLQQAMNLYCQIGRGHEALRVYQDYRKAMIRRSKAWKADPQTEHLRQKIAQDV